MWPRRSNFLAFLSKLEWGLHLQEFASIPTILLQKCAKPTILWCFPQPRRTFGDTACGCWALLISAGCYSLAETWKQLQCTQPIAHLIWSSRVTFRWVLKTLSHWPLAQGKGGHSLVASFLFQQIVLCPHLWTATRHHQRATDVKRSLYLIRFQPHFHRFLRLRRFPCCQGVYRIIPYKPYLPVPPFSAHTALSLQFVLRFHVIDVGSACGNDGWCGTCANNVLPAF